jgi:hypothetical protein
MKCPHCNQQINIGKILGSLKSKKKAESSKMNGMKGGRPKATTLQNFKSNVSDAQPNSHVEAQIKSIAAMNAMHNQGTH